MVANRYSFQFLFMYVIKRTYNAAGFRTFIRLIKNAYVGVHARVHEISKLAYICFQSLSSGKKKSQVFFLLILVAIWQLFPAAVLCM